MNDIVNLIFATKSGSIAYGTDEEKSDVDIRGVFVTPEINIRTNFKPYTEVIKGEGDTTYHELNKFLKMALDCNPNVLELLWIDSKYHIGISNEYNWLIENRNEFLSKRCIPKFLGFATSEKHRLNKIEKLTRKYNKAVSHYFRLSQMLVEILTEGVVKVNRTGIDADYIKIIKNTTDIDIINSAINDADKNINLVKNELQFDSTLQDEPNLDLALDLNIMIQDSVWRKNRQVIY